MRISGLMTLLYSALVMSELLQTFLSDAFCIAQKAHFPTPKKRKTKAHFQKAHPKLL